MKMKTGKKEAGKQDIKKEVAGFKPGPSKPDKNGASRPTDLLSSRTGGFLAHDLIEEMIGEGLPEDAEDVKAKDIVPKALKEIEDDKSVHLNAVIEGLVAELKWTGRDGPLKPIVEELLGEIDRYKPESPSENSAGGSQDLGSGRIGAFLAYEFIEDMIDGIDDGRESTPGCAEVAKTFVPEALRELEKDESVHLNAVIEGLVAELEWAGKARILKPIVDGLLSEIGKYKSGSV